MKGPKKEKEKDGRGWLFLVNCRIFEAISLKL